MKRNEYNIPEDKRYGLTPKQLAFCKEYLRTENVVESYKATYDVNSSPASISSQAYKAFNKPKVQAYIKDMQRIAYDEAIKSNKEIMSVQDTLEWLSKIVKSDSRSVKVSERIKAAELILKAGGAFIQKIEADVHSTNDIILNIVEEDDEE